MKSILIVGATSGIAEATARLWAKRGDKLFLVARNGGRLEIVANDLRVRGSSKVATYVMDANAVNSHTAMLDLAQIEMGNIDVVLIAHGSLSDQKKCQISVDLTINEINNNALSVVALLTEIATRFDKLNKGAIAVISSVAGDRGRKSNYVYGSAKGLVNKFVQGLQHRFYKSGVTVTLIKPGPTETPMTMHLKGVVSLAQVGIVARDIVRSIDRKKSLVYTPRKWQLIMLIIRSLPGFIFNRLEV